MKKIYTFFIVTSFCLYGIRSFSQVISVDTILYNGDISKLINIVMVGDGYTSSEMTKFITDVNSVKNYYFTQAPFSNYENYFNVFAIKVQSDQSGVNHPGTTSDSDCPGVPVSTVNNYFGSSFDSYAIHRLVCLQHYDSAANVLADNFPQYDIVLFIVNSPYYGGSGGLYALSTTNTNSGDVSVHEIGHSFGDLADEYWAGYKSEAANATQQSNPALIKWKNWLYDNGIGIYSYSEDPTWFRPHQNCKMRYLNVPFCSVCTEALIENIHNLVNSIYSYSPSNSSTIIANATMLDFSLNLLKPIPNTLKTEWKLNGVLKSANTDTLQINPDSLTNGIHHLVATVIDTTVLTRSDSHWTTHIYNIIWDIDKTTTGINVNAESCSTGIQVYPNPFADKLNISYYIEKDKKVIIDIIDVNGKILKKVVNKKQSAGAYELIIESSDIGNTSGIYFIKFSFDNNIIVKSIVQER